MNRRTFLMASAASAASAAGCAGRRGGELRVFVYAGGHERAMREVFSPLPLFSDYATADAALAACVQQAIEDQRVTRAEELKDLKCSKAGVASLAGIELFTGLQRLGLDGNRIASVAPLATVRWPPVTLI